MPRRDADGRLIRPARSVAPAPDNTSVQGIVRGGLFFTGEAANLAGFCMSDHLDDDWVVRDMHDIIGALGAAQSTLQLLENRAVLKSEAVAAGAAVCTAADTRAYARPCLPNWRNGKRHVCDRLAHEGRHRCLCGEEWE